MNKDNSYAVKVRTDQVNLWKGRGPLLSHLDMELTERCNNDCIHCYINLPVEDMAAKERELSTKEIKNILEEAASLGCLSVRFTGGEPLLRKDFEEIYLFSRKLGFKVLLFTNATLITPRLADLFALIPPLEKIEVSVYGMKKNSYESVTRTPGSYGAAWRGINLLLEKKVPFVVKNALLPSNQNEMEEFEAWASTIPWMYKYPSYAIFFDLRCRRDSKKKNRIIKKLRFSSEDGLHILSRRKETYIKDMKAFCSKFIALPGDKIFFCGAGIDGGCIDAYGYFQPCMMLRHPSTVYNLKKGNLKDALINFFPKVRQMTASNSDYIARCARCFLKGLCEQCPARSWMEYGTLDTPVEYFCEIAHAQASFLGLLNEGEKAWNIRDWKERLKNFTGEKPDLRERVQEACSR